MNRGKWQHRHYRIPCVFNIYYIYSTMSITIIYSTPSSTAALNSSFVSLPTTLTSISYKLLSSSRPHRSFRLRTTLPPPILCASSSLSVSGTLSLSVSLWIFFFSFDLLRRLISELVFTMIWSLKCVGNLVLGIFVLVVLIFAYV